MRGTGTDLGDIGPALDDEPEYPEDDPRDIPPGTESGVISRPVKVRVSATVVVGDGGRVQDDHGKGYEMQVISL